MPELETTPSTGTSLTAREKRDIQKSQLRPLANRRPELYEEDEYSSEEYEQMMDMYNGTLASIEEGEIVRFYSACDAWPSSCESATGPTSTFNALSFVCLVIDVFRMLSPMTVRLATALKKELDWVRLDRGVRRVGAGCGAQRPVLPVARRAVPRP